MPLKKIDHDILRVWNDIIKKLQDNTGFSFLDDIKNPYAKNLMQDFLKAFINIDFK